MSETVPEVFNSKLEESENPRLQKEEVPIGRIMKGQTFDLSRYDMDFSWKESEASDPWKVRSTIEMLRCLDQNPHIELEARVLGMTETGLKSKILDKKSFKESFQSGEKAFSKVKMKEWDSFSVTNGIGAYADGGAPVGYDFIPLLGGPFYKNLYYYTDYLRMHVECFYAYHHDPIAKTVVLITRDFVLGTGFEVQVLDESEKGEVAMAAWRAFEKVNNLHEQIDYAAVELSVYGEILMYWLPHNQAKIVYDLSSQDTIPIGMIPRVRVLDPSNMVEIVTYPEDITRPLFYVWLTPTQYQIYSSGLGSLQTQGAPIQPTLKFIYQQIPAEEIDHYKVNVVSNEKRGRSDLYPVLSYLKRQRDAVNFAIISMQKNAAWSIDTTIDGNQEDINNYMSAQSALGTIPSAGSEFVHSKAVTRNYMANQNMSGSLGNVFEWNLSMICAGVQIPINFLGTHLSGHSTRASALVATEPVIKKMEKRRMVISRIIQNCWDRYIKKQLGLNVECKIVFPEMITQDRSQKFQDLTLAQQNGWISKKRAATNAAKELGEVNFDFGKEQDEIKAEVLATPAPPARPLTDKPKNADGSELPNSSALSSDEKDQIKKHGRDL